MKNKIKIHVKNSPILLPIDGDNELKNVYSCIFNYYELKNIYAKNNREVYETEKEEDCELNKKIKPLCISCNRPVGSIFVRKINKKGLVILFARCGDRKHPCPFKILLSTGKFSDVYTKIDFLAQQILDQKTKIILGKNNLLFGYEKQNDVLDHFDEFKKQLSELNFTINKFYSHLYHYGSFNNPIWRKNFKELQEQIYSTIESIIKDTSSLSSSSVPKIADVVLQLQPLLDKLRQMKYAICYVEEKEEDEYQLIEKEHSIAQLLVEEQSPKMHVFNIKMFNV